MSLSKPSVANRPPFVMTATGVAVDNPCELVAAHYVNTTAGAGRIDIYDGTATPGNLRLTLGSDAANGNDDFSPIQPASFKNQLRVVFTTGTGVLSLLTN